MFVHLIDILYGCDLDRFLKFVNGEIEMDREDFEKINPRCEMCKEHVDYGQFTVSHFCDSIFFYHHKCYEPLIESIEINFPCCSLRQHNDVFMVTEAPTKCLLQFQVSGEMCQEKKVEGFIVNLHPKWKVVEDCKEGCGSFDEAGLSSPKDDQLIKDIIEKRKKFSKIISDRLKNIVDENIKITFDFDREHELREAWWPVIADWNGQKGLRGYLTGWNCD